METNMAYMEIVMIRFLRGNAGCTYIVAYDLISLHARAYAGAYSQEYNYIILGRPFTAQLL